MTTNRAAARWNEHGFTMLEILVVIALIGTITSMAMMVGPSFQRHARADAGLAQVLDMVRSARGLAISQRRNVELRFINTNAMQTAENRRVWFRGRHEPDDRWRSSQWRTESRRRPQRKRHTRDLRCNAMGGTPADRRARAIPRNRRADDDSARDQRGPCARANRHVLFRRALKLVNGQLGSLPPGLTVVAENPVYVQGNFNASGTSFSTTTHVPAALIADAVTFLSNNWNDIRSFTAPSDSLARPATSTIYRMALITGKGLAFPQPSGTDASFGSDGGAHNFMRSLENWNTTGTIHRYRGSMVSFFINRQGVGTFKCCDQDAYNRGDRDWSFDTDFLLPSKLPPGTPMFRDVNTLTFRQLLRPTQ